jgi:predicted nucleic acid-binding protein
VPVLIDTTVLSNLAAVERLDLLRLLSDSLYLASAVYDEIQQGVEEGYEFLASIDKSLDSGLFSLVTLEGENEWHTYRAMPDTLQRGEVMSLAIAHDRGWRFLTDDRAARMSAGRLGVSYSGTLGLLRYAVQKGHLTLEEGNALLTEMIARARYRSPVSDLRALLQDQK